MSLFKERKTPYAHQLSPVGFGLITRLMLMLMATLISIITITTSPAGKVIALAPPKKVYRYFGYGSNVIPSTMKSLRQIDVREVTAAILPDYELKFKSAAFVRPVLVANRTANDNDVKEKDGAMNDRSGRVVHGLLYTLTEDEFAKIGQTEGVPFGYRWQSCRVYPYQGDGKKAGMDCLDDPDASSVQAYTLVEPTPASSQQQRRKREQPKQINRRGDIPPSSSYLGLIREGARLWKFDRTYQDDLASIQTTTSSNLLFPDGWEGPALQFAEKASGTKRTYMIDGY